MPELWDPDNVSLVRAAVDRHPGNTKISTNGWKLVDQLESEPVRWLSGCHRLSALCLKVALCCTLTSTQRPKELSAEVIAELNPASWLLYTFDAADDLTVLATWWCRFLIKNKYD